MLIESLTLSVAGGAAGLLAAVWASGLMVGAIQDLRAPYWIDVGLDWKVLAFCVAVTAVTGLICGLVPAWLVSGTRPQEALKDAGAGRGAPRGHRIRAGLVVSQLALALVLLAGAGLLSKTVARSFAYDPGYDASRVVAGDLDLAAPRYQDPRQVVALADRLIEQLERMPHVRAAVSRTVFLAGCGGRPRQIAVEGMAAVPEGGSPSFCHAGSPGYFRALGVAVREGRDFDRSDPPGVAIVNQEMARRVWPGRSALGRRIRFGDDTPWRTIIGVVSTTGGSPLVGARPIPFAYVPFAPDAGRTIAITASTPGAVTALAAEIRAAVHTIDPDQPVEDLQTMAEAYAAWTEPARFVALMMGALAAVALLLASLGTYGVIAYGVSQRAREIGIRMALGASAGQVQALIARAGLRLTLAGIAVGLPAAFAAARTLKGILLGTSPADSAVFLAVTGILAVVALAASWLPDRRAAQVDPLTVLRSE